MASCPECRVHVDPEWRFCHACGSSLAERTAEMITPIAAAGGVTQPAPREEWTAERSTPATRPGTMSESPEPTLRRSRWPSRLSLLFGLVVGLLILALVAILATNDAGTHRSLTQTRTDLTSTRHQLSSSRSNLSTTEKQLAAITKQRDSLSLQLLAQTTTVTGLQNSLSNAQQQVDLQAGQISILKTCLQGVSNALSDVSIGDYLSAVSALDSVQVSCQSASALF